MIPNIFTKYANNWRKKKMKYIVEINGDNGDSSYSMVFDTIGDAIEEMGNLWEDLPEYTKYQLKRRNYLSKGEDKPYMVVLGGLTKSAKGIFTHMEVKETRTLKELMGEEEGEE
mgnify:CR=1 FL=1